MDGSAFPSLVNAVVLMSMLVAAVIVVTIFVLRAQRRAQGSLDAEVVSRWRPLMLRAMGGALSPGELSAMGELNERDAPAVLTLWNQYLESLRGDAVVGLRHLAAAIDLHGRAREMVVRGTGSHRVVGLMTLSHLATPQDWELLQTSLHDADPSVSLLAAKALLKCDATTALPMVLDCYVSRKDWPTPSVATLLSAIDQNHVAQVLATLVRGALPAAQLQLMPLLRVTGSSEVQLAIAFLLDTAQDPHVLAAALAQARSPQCHARVHALTYHQDAQVRSYAARGLALFARLDEASHGVDPTHTSTRAVTPTRADRRWISLRHLARRALRSQPPEQPASASVAAFASHDATVASQRAIDPAVSAHVAVPSSPAATSASEQQRIAYTDVDRLLALLSDESALVREQAAYALINTVGVSRSHALRWAEQTDDARARLHLRVAWADARFAHGQTNTADIELMPATSAPEVPPVASVGSMPTSSPSTTTSSPDPVDGVDSDTLTIKHKVLS